MPLCADIRIVAAEVSWKSTATRTRRVVYKVMPDGYRAIRTEDGVPPSPEHSCVKSRGASSSRKMEDAFWKLERSCEGNLIVAELLHTCTKLNKRGIQLVYNGVPVTNFFAANGYFDSTPLGNMQVSAPHPDTGKDFSIGLHATVERKRQLAGMPAKVQSALGRMGDSITQAESKHMQKLAKDSGIPNDKLVMHWWSCFTLEDGHMVHIDLCGPACDLFSYEEVASCPGHRAPVHIVITPTACLCPLISDLLSQKFLLLRCAEKPAEDGSHPVIRLPVDFPPFVSGKLSPEVTPADEMIRRHLKPLMQINEQVSAVTDDVLLAVIKQATQRKGKNIEANVSGLESRPALNGTCVKAICVVNGRVGIELESGEQILVLPCKLSLIADECCSQMVTLKNMTAQVKITGSSSGSSGSGEVDDDGKVRKEKVDDDGKAKEGKKIEKADDNKVAKRSPAKAQAKPAAKKKADGHMDAQLDRTGASRAVEFLKGPLGELFQRVCLQGEIKMTTLTDPGMLEAFTEAVECKLAETFFTPDMQKQWEVMLELSRRKNFQEFRTMVEQVLKGDLTSNIIFQAYIGKDPEAKEMLDACVEAKILTKTSEESVD